MKCRPKISASNSSIYSADEHLVLARIVGWTSSYQLPPRVTLLRTKRSAVQPTLRASVISRSGKCKILTSRVMLNWDVTSMQTYFRPPLVKHMLHLRLRLPFGRLYGNKATIQIPRPLITTVPSCLPNVCTIRTWSSRTRPTSTMSCVSCASASEVSTGDFASNSWRRP